MRACVRAVILPGAGMGAHLLHAGVLWVLRELWSCGAVLADDFKMGEEGYTKNFIKAGGLAATTGISYTSGACGGVCRFVLLLGVSAVAAAAEHAWRACRSTP